MTERIDPPRPGLGVAIRIAWYRLLNAVTGRAVVIITEYHGEDRLRLVRYRLMFGGVRPVALRWMGATPAVLLPDGEIGSDTLTRKWRPLFGTFTPSLGGKHG